MKNNRVNEIDLLRFIAALSVVIFHYTFRGYAADNLTVMPYPILAPFSKYGYLGVELFFMISGFVILMSAGNGNLKNFIISRCVRLYPAFWACCTITFLVTLAIGAPRYSANFIQYLANMTMLSEFLGVKSIDGTYWSLFVEMRFYLLVAFVLIFGGINRLELILLIWLIVSIALVLLDVGGFVRNFLIVDFSAYFIAGAVCFLIWRDGLSKFRICIFSGAWCFAIFQVFNVLPLFEKHYKEEMSRYVVVGIIVSYFIVMLLIALRRTGFIMYRQWTVLGALTYPLYLIHHNIGFIIFNLFYPKINEHVILSLTLMLAILSAYIVNIFVERRFSPVMKIAINNFANFLGIRIRLGKLS